MTKFEKHDVVLVPFPFADLSTKKKRPALVLKKIVSRGVGNLVICAMITSQVGGERLEGDILLEQWQEAGLLHASKLRLAKIVTLDEKLVLKKMGRLNTKDIKTVKVVFLEMFEF